MSQNRGDTEYSLQYFKFTPEHFFREFSELLVEEMSTMVQHCITEFASPTCPLDNREDLRRQVLDMHKRWCDSATDLLNKIEPLVKTYFTIPPNVLLNNDKMCKQIYTEEEVKVLETEVVKLEKLYGDECRELTFLESLLKSKVESIEPLFKLVDDASAAISPISDTINDIKNLDHLLNAYLKVRNKVLENEDDGDVSIMKHKHLFHSTSE
ncbi:hypothetical protein RI129_011112 [Pyrocoelia pectoralis]|uniref:Protein MIS12 homolog n=1 Tax=Pyrocoelia pectoralis TaxID=417401 RepID=A0AAN7V7G1_9COLE